MKMFRTGLKSMDDGHMMVLRVLEEISRDIAVSDRDEARRKALLLARCLYAHFQDEEELMMSFFYPRAGTHIENHNAALTSVFAFVDAMESEAWTAAAENMIRELKTGFFDGLLRDDVEVARYMGGLRETSGMAA
ncbi:MAG: hypothetical protein M0006_02090 [Magnetospirillum sp.]|nr:hypothetical protein [Magnetospirillum sp.]